MNYSKRCFNKTQLQELSNASVVMLLCCGVWFVGFFYLTTKIHNSIYRALATVDESLWDKFTLHFCYQVAL